MLAWWVSMGMQLSLIKGPQVVGASSFFLLAPVLGGRLPASPARVRPPPPWAAAGDQAKVHCNDHHSQNEPNCVCIPCNIAFFSFSKHGAILKQAKVEDKKRAAIACASGPAAFVAH